jgi:hypothetical protein
MYWISITMLKTPKHSLNTPSVFFCIIIFCFIFEVCRSKESMLTKRRSKSWLWLMITTKIKKMETSCRSWHRNLHVSRWHHFTMTMNQPQYCPKIHNIMKIISSKHQIAPLKLVLSHRVPRGDVFAVKLVAKRIIVNALSKV